MACVIIGQGKIVFMSKKAWSYDRIFVWGDCHNSPGILLWKQTNYDIRNSLFINVGDFCIGINEPEYDYTMLRNLEMNLNLRNNDLWVVRGNHDNPSVFRPETCGFYNNSRVKFLSDYTYRTVNGKKFLFVGGAISIDRKRSVEGLNYWKDENFVLHEDYKNLEKCDVLITHSAPLEAFPSDGFGRIQHWFIEDPSLPNEFIKEREDISTLFHIVEPKKCCYGHFHLSNFEQLRGCDMKCLDINELYELHL